jgi:hypothetical protein
VDRIRRLISLTAVTRTQRRSGVLLSCLLDTGYRFLHQSPAGLPCGLRYYASAIRERSTWWMSVRWGVVRPALALDLLGNAVEARISPGGVEVFGDGGSLSAKASRTGSNWGARRRVGLGVEPSAAGPRTHGQEAFGVTDKRSLCQALDYARCTTRRR